MNIYLTSGSMDFMESVRNRFLKENMVVMHGIGNSILLHETAGKTLFATPQNFKVISSAGTLTEKGFFALNYIPITDEGRPIFEHQFHSKADSIEEARGFIAFRLLQPIKSDTYIILTQWDDTFSFNLWKNSTSYKSVLADSQSGLSSGNRHYMFSSAPYVATYQTKEEDEEN